jgi:hypothetical protein
MPVYNVGNIKRSKNLVMTHWSLLNDFRQSGNKYLIPQVIIFILNEVYKSTVPFYTFI